MTIVAVLIVGAVSYLGFGRLNSSAGELFSNLNACQSFSSAMRGLVTIQSNTFKLIAWTVSDYPPAKIDKLSKETLQSLDGSQGFYRSHG